MIQLTMGPATIHFLCTEKEMKTFKTPVGKKKEDEQTYIRWAKKLTEYQTWASWMGFSSILSYLCVTNVINTYKRRIA